MPNIRQYRDINRGENEWLSEPPENPSEEDQKAWNKDWDDIHKENAEAGLPADIKVDFTDGIYTNEEYLDPPEWIALRINDSGVLPFKMARGIIKGYTIEGLRSMQFIQHFDVWIDSDWGGFSYTRIDIYDDQAYLTFSPKHASGEVEVNITEQFNQAIGE